MPCSDNPGQCHSRPEPKRDDSQLKEAYKALNDKLHETEAMLCAMCNEVPRKQMFEAEVNGKCVGIELWFKAHRKKDVQKLMDNGLPSNAS